MNYNYYKIFVVLENGEDFDFVLAGADVNSIGVTVSFLFR